MVKSYIKNTSEFLCKLDALRSLPDDLTLYITDVASLYPNILHEDGLVAMWKAFYKK